MPQQDIYFYLNVSVPEKLKKIIFIFPLNNKQYMYLQISVWFFYWPFFNSLLNNSYHFHTEKKIYKLKIPYDMHLLNEMRLIVTKGWTSRFKVTQVRFTSTSPLALIPKGRIRTRLVTTTSVISRTTLLFCRRTEIIFSSREY